MYAVVRIRGLVKTKKDLEDAMLMLRLNRKMHCVLLNKGEIVDGMLKKVRDRVTWGEINDDTLRALIEKRARKPGNTRLTKQEAEEVFNKTKNEQKVPDTIKPVFRLTPPSKGFKESIKQHYPKGELGYRGEKINELLKRMI
jgi:large subunit ribosomal protein L30